MTLIAIGCMDQTANEESQITSSDESIVSTRNGYNNEGIQNVTNAIQLGLIDLMQEDKFKNFIRELSEEAGEEQQYTFSNESLVSLYNEDGDNLVEKVYQSALSNSNNDEDIALLAQNSFESFNIEEEILYPFITNPFVMQDYPLSDEYADWDGLSPEYIAYAAEEEENLFGYQLDNESGEASYFESEGLKYTSIPGWFISVDPSSDPPNPEGPIVVTGRCPWTCEEGQSCSSSNSGPVCSIELFGFISIFGADCPTCASNY